MNESNSKSTDVIPRSKNEQNDEPLTDHSLRSQSGVDLTLIRWMASITPQERLNILQNNVASILRIRNENKRAWFCYDYWSATTAWCRFCNCRRRVRSASRSTRYNIWSWHRTFKLKKTLHDYLAHLMSLMPITESIYQSVSNQQWRLLDQQATICWQPVLVRWMCWVRLELMTIMNDSSHTLTPLKSRKMLPQKSFSSIH